MKAVLMLGLIAGVVALTPMATAHAVYIDYDPATGECFVVQVVGDPNSLPHACLWTGPRECQDLCDHPPAGSLLVGVALP